MKDVPVIETDRLILRAHRPEDLPACTAMWADPNVVKYIGGKPFTEQETWMRMLRYIGMWSFIHYGFWAVEEKASGKFIGEMGFADFKRVLNPSIAGIPEVGWCLETGSHRKGYATEGLKAVIAWGDKNFAWKRTVCIIEPGNAASLKLAQKFGYTEVTKTSYNDTPILLFERII